MTLLTREEILTANDLPRERVPVPEWGGEVLVQGMSAIERDAFDIEMMQADGSNSISVETDKGTSVQINASNMRAKLAARCMVDNTGALLFTDPKDVEALGRKSAVALNRVFEVAQRLSALNKTAVEGMTKNSGSGQHADSPSA